MTSFYDELASHLENLDNTFIYASNTDRNVFTGVLPQSPDDCVAFFGLPGTNLTAQRDIPDLHFPRIQVLCRSVDYETGSDYLERVRAALHGIIAQDLTEWHIMRLHAEQEGGPIGQDDQGRFEFSITFMGEYYKIP